MPGLIQASKDGRERYGWRKEVGEGENKDMEEGQGKPNRAWEALQGLDFILDEMGVTGRFSAEEVYGLTWFVIRWLLLLRRN